MMGDDSSSSSSSSSSSRGGGGEPFSVAVLGLGMIGSAAARHLSSSLPFPASVLAIGSPEPHRLSWSSHAGPFSSHYDQGRIILSSMVDPIWSPLASRAMARYADIEHRSGLRFHHASGCLFVSPFENEPGYFNLLESLVTGLQNGAAVVDGCLKTSQELERMFPFLGFSPGDKGLVEGGLAGWINPRILVKAQLALARKNGATIVEEIVTDVECGHDVVKISTDSGRVFMAHKALVCAGAYSGFLLQKQKKQLDLRIKAVSVVLAEVDGEELAKLQAMPSLVWRLGSHPQFRYIYACPPIAYPDGKFYIKIGGESWTAPWVDSEEEVREWFHGSGDPVETTGLLQILKELMPKVSFKSVETKPCILTFTAHGHPYIDAADGRPLQEARLFVATGGCGESATLSDEIGRIAALMVNTGSWTYDLDSLSFKTVFKEGSSKPGD